MAIVGRYRILGELGQGGMADVYLAAPEGAPPTESLMVIKRLRNLEPDHLAMFLDEARIARRLSHRNIVRTHDIGQENGSHFIVMEYLHGPTLFHLRRNALPHLPWPIEIDIACSVLDGLHYAHELRAVDGTPLHVVHRDLSPENVIVTEEGEAKILDFGIAKAIDSISQTQAGAFKGKLRSMPPEQLRGERVDRRADVYAAGVMLCEGLIGQALWGDLGNVEITTRLARMEVPSVHEFAAALPPELRAICARATDLRPENRFASALEFKEALLACAQRSDLLVPRPELAAYVARKFAAGRDRIERMVRGTLAQPDGAGKVLPGVVSLSPVDDQSGRRPAVTRVAASLRDRPERSSVSGELSTPSETMDGAILAPAARPAWARRRLPALVGTAALVTLVISALAHRKSAPPTVPERPSAAVTPAVPVAGPAEPRPRWVALPQERTLARAEPPARPAQATARSMPSREPIARSRQRRTAQRRAAASVDPPPLPAVEGPAVEQPRRWNGRVLDLENPYPNDGAGVAPTPRPRRRIDPSNPWPTGGGR
jgi:serine/threonine protein kinase